MSSDGQAKDNTTHSVNKTRLSDKVKKLSNGIKMFFYSEYTEDKGGDVEVVEAVKDGNVVGRYVKKDDKVVETSASSDAQTSGQHEKMAVAAGVKKDQITSTAPSAVAKDADPTVAEKTSMGVGAEEIGSISDNQADTPDKPEKVEDADLHPKTKKESGGPKEGKPDKSLFKPKESKESSSEGDFKAEKTSIGKAPKQSESKSGGPKEGKPDKSMSKMASMDTSNKDLAKSDDTTEKLKAFLEKLKNMPKEERVAHNKQVLNEMLDSKPRTRDEKIAAALSRQADKGSPYTEPRKTGLGNEGVHRQESAPQQSEPSSNVKPLLLKDMARYKKFTGSGRPFRIMLGMHESHKGLSGAHHVLEKPLSIKQLHEEMKHPTSEISRKVLDALESGHDALYIHQPSGGRQKGHLKVMKSISEQMEVLKKNITETDLKSKEWHPTTHTTRPEIMNKAPTHSEHAKSFAAGVMKWISGRPERMKQAENLQKDWDSGAVAQIMHAHKNNGGSTFSLKHGHVSGDLYAVSPYLQQSQVFSGELKPEHVHNFIKQNYETLQKPDHHVGTWHDKSSGNHYLDIVVTTPDKNKAIELGKKHNQKAVFHLGSNTEIPTGGTGEK